MRVSSRFQVVVPKEIREAMGIRRGMRLLALQEGSRVALVPSRDLHDAQGFLHGIAVTVKREPDRL